MKMPSQQEVWHPNNKSQIQQEDSRHKEDSLRKCLPNRKADTQIAIHKPNWKTCLPNRKTDTQTANQHQKRKTCPRKKWFFCFFWWPSKPSSDQAQARPQNEKQLKLTCSRAHMMFVFCRCPPTEGLKSKETIRNKKTENQTENQKPCRDAFPRKYNHY